MLNWSLPYYIIVSHVCCPTKAKQCEQRGQWNRADPLRQDDTVVQERIIHHLAVYLWAELVSAAVLLTSSFYFCWTFFFFWRCSLQTEQPLKSKTLKSQFVQLYICDTYPNYQTMSYTLIAVTGGIWVLQKIWLRWPQNRNFTPDFTNPAAPLWPRLPGHFLRWEASSIHLSREVNSFSALALSDQVNRVLINGGQGEQNLVLQFRSSTVWNVHFFIHLVTILYSLYKGM